MKAAFFTVLLVMGITLAQQTDTTQTDTQMAATNTTATNTDFVALSEEFKTISTETYYLASVDNSGVDGYVQLAEVYEGGSRIIVSMNNTLADYRYAVVLYEGDCGPDRPEIARLGDINNTSGDPNTSITESEISFDQLRQGNYFMYVFAGEPGSRTRCKSNGDVSLHRV
jgi:hypothetical protein